MDENGNDISLSTRDSRQRKTYLLTDTAEDIRLKQKQYQIDDDAGKTILNKLRTGDTIDLDNLISYDALFDAYSEEFYDATNLTFRTPNALGDLKVEIVDDLDEFAGTYFPLEDKITKSLLTV